VVDRRQVSQRRERGVGGDPLGHGERAVAGGAAGAVGHRDEVRPEALELADRLPELALTGLGLGREELEGEQRLTAREHVADRRGSHPPSLGGRRPAPAAIPSGPMSRSLNPSPLDREDLRQRVQKCLNAFVAGQQHVLDAVSAELGPLTDALSTS
jgi:hypothetical protein